MVEPDEPRTYSASEMQELVRKLLHIPRPGFVDHSRSDRPDPPFVRPVNFKCECIAQVDNPLLTPSEKVCIVISSHLIR